MHKWLLLLAFFCTIVASVAYAQFIHQRFLPANGERGKLGAAQQYPHVQIGKALLRLAPGARLYDQGNRTLVHGQLPEGVEVLFAKDQTGSVNRIYILTEQELVNLAQAGRR